MQRSSLIALLRRHVFFSWALVLLLLFKVSIASACEGHEVHAIEHGDTAALVIGVDSSPDDSAMPADLDHERVPPSSTHHSACAHCGCCAHAFVSSTGPAVMPMPAGASRMASHDVRCPGAYEAPGIRPPIA